MQHTREPTLWGTWRPEVSLWILSCVQSSANGVHWGWGWCDRICAFSPQAWQLNWRRIVGAELEFWVARPDLSCSSWVWKEPRKFSSCERRKVQLLSVAASWSMYMTCYDQHEWAWSGKPKDSENSWKVCRGPVCQMLLINRAGQEVWVVHGQPPQERPSRLLSTAVSVEWYWW